MAVGFSGLIEGDLNLVESLELGLAKEIGTGFDLKWWVFSSN